jgi:hypothetical protein
MGTMVRVLQTFGTVFAMVKCEKELYDFFPKVAFLYILHFIQKCNKKLKILLLS